jgi:hypothetical protein
MKKLIVAILFLSFISGGRSIACTGIYYEDGNIVLAGNNEDWMNPFSKIWFLPAEQNKYARVYFGFSEGGTQGGVNDQGLFFDGFATKSLKVSLSTDKKVYEGDLAQKVMEECSTVDEVVAVFERYNLQFMESSMFFFGDKYGNSVIIEGDDIIRKSGTYQIVTNFHQSSVNPDSIEDRRYLIAKNILSEEKHVDADVIRKILANTHQEGKYPTQYSNIYDLKNGKIYLYHFHNYENVVEININDEFKKGKHSIDLSTLFPKSNAAEYYTNSIQNEMDKRIAERNVIKIDNVNLERYVGLYEINHELMPGYTLEISCTNNKLFVEMSFLEKTEIMPESITNFFSVGVSETFEYIFKPDINLDEIHLVARMYGLEMPATKIE